MAGNAVSAYEPNYQPLVCQVSKQAVTLDVVVVERLSRLEGQSQRLRQLPPRHGYTGTGQRVENLYGTYGRLFGPAVTTGVFPVCLGAGLSALEKRRLQSLSVPLVKGVDRQS